MHLPRYGKLSEDSTEEEIIDLTIRSARFLGVHATASHCSEVQHAHLLEIITLMCNTYNKLPSHQKSSAQLASTEDIFLKYTGQISDHANDQKLVYRIRRDFKARLWAKKLAEDRLESLTESEWVKKLETERDAKIDAAGGIELWEAMSLEQQAELETRACAATMDILAQEGFEALPDNEKAIMKTCIWSRCASHKAMNIFKAGEKEMHASWRPEDQSPIKLFNKDNLAAVAELVDNSTTGTIDENDPGYGAVQSRANAVSESGGHKLTSLSAGVFNHKDKKKGQQETYRPYLEVHTGSRKLVADASNNHYGSHGDTASDLIEYFDHIIRFLEHICDVKGEMTWTNMEANVLKGLMCTSTQAELCAMLIFSQCVFHPWMRHAHLGERDLSVNALNEGQWYEQATEFMASVIHQPQTVLDNTGYNIATLDGQPWKSQSAIDATRKLASTLPHTHRCVVAFFQGALNACARFLVEFEIDGEIDQSSAMERELSYRPPTNDRSESELALLRRADQKGKIHNTLRHNSSNMYARNDTAAWHAHHLASQDFEGQQEFSMYVSKHARSVEKTGGAKEKQREIIRESERKAEINRIMKKAKDDAQAQQKQHIALIQLQRNPSWPTAKGVTIALLKDQLLAYRAVFKEKFGLLGLKKDLLAKVISDAILRYNELQLAQANDGQQVPPSTLFKV